MTKKKPTHRIAFARIIGTDENGNDTADAPTQDTADAVTAATSVLEGKVSKTLKSFLKKATVQGICLPFSQ